MTPLAVAKPDAARMIGVSMRRLRSLIAQGHLTPTWFGSIPVAQLQALVGHDGDVETRRQMDGDETGGRAPGLRVRQDGARGRSGSSAKAPRLGIPRGGHRE